MEEKYLEQLELEFSESERKRNLERILYHNFKSRLKRFMDFGKSEEEMWSEERREIIVKYNQPLPDFPNRLEITERLAEEKGKPKNYFKNIPIHNLRGMYKEMCFNKELVRVDEIYERT